MIPHARLALVGKALDEWLQGLSDLSGGERATIAILLYLLGYMHRSDNFSITVYLAPYGGYAA